MTTAIEQLQIRRIYSSGPAKAPTIQVGQPARLGVSALGVLGLLLAGSWIYLAWWPADRLIGANLMSSGLAHFAAMGAMGDVFGTAPTNLANPAPPEGTEAALVPVSRRPRARDQAEIEASLARGERTMRWLGGTMWTWLAISTVVGGWLGLCGGAAAASVPVADGTRRRRMLLGAIVLALVAGGISIRLWKGQGALGLSRTTSEMAFVTLVFSVGWLLAVTLSGRSAGRVAGVLTLVLICAMVLTGIKLQTGYPSGAPRIAVAVGMVIAILIGATAVNRSAGLHWVAIGLVLLAAVGTVIALKVAASMGGVHTHDLTFSTYVAIGAVQASYAMVLLGARAFRLR